MSVMVTLSCVRRKRDTPDIRVSQGGEVVFHVPQNSSPRVWFAITSCLGGMGAMIIAQGSVT
jgi:hypothetical protein